MKIALAAATSPPAKAGSATMSVVLSNTQSIDPLKRDLAIDKFDKAASVCTATHEPSFISPGVPMESESSGSNTPSTSPKGNCTYIIGSEIALAPATSLTPNASSLLSSVLKSDKAGSASTPPPSSSQLGSKKPFPKVLVTSPHLGFKNPTHILPEVPMGSESSGGARYCVTSSTWSGSPKAVSDTTPLKSEDLTDGIEIGEEDEVNMFDILVGPPLPPSPSMCAGPDKRYIPEMEHKLVVSRRAQKDVIGPIFPRELSPPPSPRWEEVPLPIDAGTLINDITFTGAEGFCVGSSRTFLQMSVGEGCFWQPRTMHSELEEEVEEYKDCEFKAISFCGVEGWIVGSNPSLFLHSSDNGNSWERRLFLSGMFGDVCQVFALAPGCAVITTDLRASYITRDEGGTWSQYKPCGHPEVLPCPQHKRGFKIVKGKLFKLKEGIVGARREVEILPGPPHPPSLPMCADPEEVLNSVTIGEYFPCSDPPHYKRQVKRYIPKMEDKLVVSRRVQKDVIAPIFPRELSPPPSPRWEEVPLPVDAGTLINDITFTGSEGFCVGSSRTFLQMSVGEGSWQPRTMHSELEEEVEDYKDCEFKAISFCGMEGWIVGSNPSLFLHSSDKGNSWERRLFLSGMFGNVCQVFALAPGCAVITTDLRASYITRDEGGTWSLYKPCGDLEVLPCPQHKRGFKIVKGKLFKLRSDNHCC